MNVCKYVNYIYQNCNHLQYLSRYEIEPEIVKFTPKSCF